MKNTMSWILFLSGALIAIPFALAGTDTPAIPQLDEMRVKLDLPESAKTTWIYILSHDSESSCFIQTTPAEIGRNLIPNPPLGRVRKSSDVYSVTNTSTQDGAISEVDFTNGQPSRDAYATVVCIGSFKTLSDVIHALVKSPEVKLSWADRADGS